MAEKPRNELESKLTLSCKKTNNWLTISPLPAATAPAPRIGRNCDGSVEFVSFSFQRAQHSAMLPGIKSPETCSVLVLRRSTASCVFAPEKPVPQQDGSDIGRMFYVSLYKKLSAIVLEFQAVWSSIQYVFRMETTRVPTIPAN